LLNDGGIYADIDVLLNTHLDEFLLPDMSFFTSMDGVLGYSNEPFCLWNGLMGSRKGHPFLLRVVENIVGKRVARRYFIVQKAK
jgi:mannosyltransferase OCH1-like enzyme